MTSVEKYITTPLTKEKVSDLVAGDYVYITGTIFTARDAAHKRMYEAILNNKEIPIRVENAIIYYLGPTPAKENQVIGSAVPQPHRRSSCPQSKPAASVLHQRSK